MRFTLVVADASRARIYSIEPSSPDEPRRGVTFHERADLVNPERRHPVSNALSDRPGTAYSPTGLGFGLDDHREDYTREVDRRFATEIATRLAETVRETGVGRAVVVASPRLLGMLRRTTAALGKAVTVETIALDLTRRTTPQLHDQLADLGLVPARERVASPASS